MSVLANYLSRIRENAEKVFIGTTVLNRIDEKEMHTAGMYVNSVPVLVTVGGNCTFRQCLQETEDMQMSVFRHQRYNYTQVKKDLAEQQSFTGQLYDVMLHFVNATVDHADHAKHVWYHNGIQNESLQIHIDDRDSEGMFHMTYDYQVGKFSSQEIKALHGHLMNLLHDGMEHPQKECGALRMLSAEEEYWIQVECNDTAKEYNLPEDATISSLFEENAERNCDKPCVFIDGNSVTYGEFLQKSRMIDAEIRRRTNGKKSVVAVMHDLTQAVKYADDILLIDGGKLVFAGTKEKCLDVKAIQKIMEVESHVIEDGTVVFI